MHQAVPAATHNTSFRPDNKRIAAIFFAQSIVGSMLYMRIPDLQIRASLSEGELGFVLTGGPVGALAIYAFASRFIEKFGTRRAIFWTFILGAFSAALLSSVIHPVLMFVILALNGAISSAANIAINVEADRVENGTQSRIMNWCHGMWSIGYFLAALIAGGLRGVGVDPEVHLWILFPLFSLLTLVLVPRMREFAPRLHTGAATARGFVLPTLAVCALVAFGLGAELLEGSSRVWATIYIRDGFDVLPIIESAAPVAIVFTMAAGRLVADRWIDRYGPRRAAGVSLIVAQLGLVALVLAPNAYVAIVGFAVAGCGVGIVYPLMLSSAARLGDRPASENVAAITLIIQLVMLVAPLVIGVIAEGFGVRAAFGSLLPLLAVGLVMSRTLR